jgi:hypothetical protein
MGQEMAINKTMVTKAVISKIEDESRPKKIKAKHISGYETPNKITYKGNNEQYIPDIAAYYDKSTNIYEIELDDSMPVKKWQLFSDYAKSHHGKLILIVPDFLLENVKQEVENQNFSVELIYFNSE